MSDIDLDIASDVMYEGLRAEDIEPIPGLDLIVRRVMERAIVAARSGASATVYIGIGNSDDKLTQAEWHAFCVDVGWAIDNTSKHIRVLGCWYSAPDSEWQNACWCITVDSEHVAVLDGLRDLLAVACRDYRQDSIAWAEAATEFIEPKEPASYASRIGERDENQP